MIFSPRGAQPVVARSFSPHWFGMERRLKLRATNSIRALICGGIFCTASALHAVAPNLVSVTPAGGQRGSAVEVTFRGDRLADAEEIFFYSPGITVEKITEPADKVVKVTLKIAADCRIGEHALRVRTAGGISALRLFYVGPFPNVLEKEPNNEREKAQTLALNTTVEGSIGSEDVDYFAVEAKQGQRLSLEIEGARLGRTMFDPTIAIQDATGRVVASSDDTPLLGHDSFVSMIVPNDGKYFVHVRDMTYSGNGHFYRLHVGDFPRPAVVFPLGGQPGETLQAKFLGDPVGEFSQPVKLPAATAEKFGALAEHGGASPSPNWLRVSPQPNAEWVQPASTQAKAPLLNLPAPLAFNGILETKGDAAFFRFTAKKDQNLDFTVFARRLGSPLDSVLTIFDAKGKNLGSNDDAAGNPDSTVRVRIPADGDYTVKVADQLNRGGPLYTYRVEVAEVKPVLTLSIPDTARYDNETRKSIVVPRGNRFAVLMNIARDGFNGDLNLAFDGLPAGITAQADTVPGSLSAVPVVFEAAADAEIAGSLLTPAGKPADATKSGEITSRFRHTVEWVRIQNDTVYVKSEVNRIAAAVAEEAPFRVRIVEPKVPLVQTGEMALQIVAERKEGFDEPITVKMLWNPPGITSQPDMVIAKGATSIAYKLNSTNKAETRPWKIAVVASATVKGGTAYVSTQLAPLEVAPSHLLGKIDPAKVERGQTGKMVCVLDQKIPFEGTALATLTGLPDNITAKPVEITKDSKEAVFEIVTNEKSPGGNHKSVGCRVVITRDGEPITHLLAAGSILRVDIPRAIPAAPAAKPVAQVKE